MCLNTTPLICLMLQVPYCWMCVYAHFVRLWLLPLPLPLFLFPINRSLLHYLHYYNICIILFLFFIEYSWFTMLISAGEQGDSVLHTCIFLFILLSTMVYRRIENMVPFAIQKDLSVYRSPNPTLDLSLPLSKLLEMDRGGSGPKTSASLVWMMYRATFPFL